MAHVVVLLTTDSCPESEQPSRCVMDVIGPFDTRGDATAFAETCPRWSTPHVMRLEPVGDWDLHS